MEDVLQSDSRLQRAACEFVLWVLRNASEEVAAAVARPVLHGVIHALNVLLTAEHHELRPSRSIRKLLYQAVGLMAEVRPTATSSTRNTCFISCSTGKFWWLCE